MLASAALPVHLCALLHTAVLQVVWISIEVAFKCAAVTTGCLSVAVVGTGFIKAGNTSCMVASRESFFHHDQTSHFFWVLLALDYAPVTAWQLFFHFDAAI